MKKNIRTVFITMLLLFAFRGKCFADVIMPGETEPSAGHGMWRSDTKYKMTSTPSIWIYILIGITIIAIVNVVILIILKKSKNKKEKELNDKTDNK